MEYLVEPIQAFKNSTKTNIAIFRPYNTTDDTLYHDLEEACARMGTVKIVNEIFLSSYEGMNRGLVDILIVPELELVNQHYQLKKFCAAGGAVIYACKDYFVNGHVLDTQFSQSEMEAEAGEEHFRNTIGYLGIKPYITDITPVIASADPAWIPGAGTKQVKLPRAGVQMNVSSEKIPPMPPYGNVFIERYEVLRNYDAVIGCDAYGRKINSQVNFAQNWENGARYVLYSANGENSLIRKSHPLFDDALEAAIRFCENKVFAVSCYPNYACYRGLEDVTVDYQIKNTGKDVQSIDIVLEILDCSGNSVFRECETVTMTPHSSLKKSVCWKNNGFDCDSYSILLSVSRDGQLLSQADNGFVVWNEEVIKNGPTVTAAGKYFDINGKASMITGTNYYESNIGEVMWVKPNIRKLETDFKQMSADGINYIRIHYHHVKWFKDYLKNCTGEIFDYYQDLEEDYLPNERILRIFDAHIYLSQKYQIIYGGDLFTLIPEEMGDPKGWFGVQDYLWFEDKIAAQKEFLDRLIPRYTEVPGIAWDIYNEPISCDPCTANKHIFDAAFYRWGKDIREYMRSIGDRHMITVGAENPKRFEDFIDFFAEHVNFKYISERKCDTELPELVQECWLDCPPTPEGDQKQLDDIRKALTDILELGFAGFVPWQWTNQQRLWCDNRTGWAEKWDDRLGTCVRNDGTLKPAGRFYRDFVRFIDGLSFLGYADGAVDTGSGKLAVEHCEDGSRKIRYYEDGAIVREIARKSIVGKTLSIQSGTDADLFYIAGNGADYMKVNKAGILSLKAKQVPVQIEICEKPGESVIAALDTVSGAEFQLNVTESDVNYWYKLSY